MRNISAIAEHVDFVAIQGSEVGIVEVAATFGA